MKRTCAVFIAMALMLCALPAFAAQSDGFTVSDVGAIDVEQFSDGYAPYYSDGLYGIVRYDGRIISEPVYQDIRAYGENLWPVQTEHGWQLDIMVGTTAIAGRFDSAGAYKYGSSVVSVNGLYGVISPSGAFVIEPIWDFIADYNELGCTCAESEGRWTIINSQGETITEFDYDSITDYDSAFIGVRGNLYDVILPDGSRVRLNGGTRIVYLTLFGDQRRVEVDGEAYFEVEHDARRPFVVVTGEVSSTVLGTPFNVHA